MSINLRNRLEFLRNATHPFIGTDFATGGTEPGLAEEGGNPFFMALWADLAIVAALWITTASHL